MLATTVLALLLTAPSIGLPAVTARLAAPARLTVGDPFEVTMVLLAPHPTLATGPLLDSLGTFMVVSEKHATRRRGETDETTYRVKLACFQPGRHVVPGFVFLLSGRARTDTLRTDTVAVTVASVMPPAMKDVRPLRPAEGFPNLALWLVPAALLLLVALALLARRLYRRLRHGDDADAPALPPWEEALASLDALPWRQWLADGQAKRYYYALSEILKRYMERRFAFDAVEQTTTEILASMRAGRVPMRDEVSRFFARYDLVKYAKWVPAEDESEQAIEQVREFVLRTRPAEPEAPAPESPEPTAQRAGSGGA